MREGSCILLLFFFNKANLLPLLIQKSYYTFIRMEFSIKFLLLSAFVISSILYNATAQQTLGPNLIINPSFSIPQLAPGVNMTSYHLGVYGWNCINYCFYESIPLICQTLNLACNVTKSQGIDLNSQCFFENVSQTVTIEATGTYLFQIQWVIPLYKPMNKSFGIYFNGVLMQSITITTNIYKQNVKQITVNVDAGSLYIVLMMLGVRTDCWGVVITNVELKRIMPSVEVRTAFQKNLQLIIGETNPVMSCINKIPGNRIFLNVLMGQYRMVDRIQFYYYHKQNFTSYSELALSLVNSFMQKKSSMFQQIMQNCHSTNSFCRSINEGYYFLLNNLNKKQEYSDSNFLSKNSNGIGFYANNLDFLFYQLTGVIVFQIALSLIFRALFNYPISVYLRLYSFYGSIIFIILEGNVEQFSFYFFAECKLLFSANFFHKFGNVFLILLFLLMILFIVGGLLWFHYHYRKKIKYFIQDYKKATLITLFYQSMEKSFFPLIFGSIHILCIDDLSLQTILLTVTQLVYLFVRVISSKSIFPKQKIKIVITVVASFLRIVLILTLFFFQNHQMYSFLNQIHFVIIVTYLVNGVFQFLSNVIYFSAQFKDKWASNHQKRNQFEKEKQQQQLSSSRRNSQQDIISIKINYVTQKSENKTIKRNPDEQKYKKDTLFYYLRTKNTNESCNTNWRKIIQKSCKNLQKNKTLHEKSEASTHRFLMINQNKITSISSSKFYS